MNPFSIAANGAWVLSSLPEALAFRRGLIRVAEEQERILLGILRSNAQTSFGRAHGFASIHTVREYQDRIPVRTYDDLADEMRRVEAGEANVLTTAPIDHFEPTSGSSGASAVLDAQEYPQDRHARQRCSCWACSAPQTEQGCGCM